MIAYAFTPGVIRRRKPELQRSGALSANEQIKLAAALHEWADIVARRAKLSMIARNHLAWAHVAAVVA